MEESTTHNLNFFAALEASAYEYLSPLRGWQNLEIGTEGSTIWLKNLNFEQINAPLLLQIPFVKRQAVWLTSHTLIRDPPPRNELHCAIARIQIQLV